MKSVLFRLFTLFIILYLIVVLSEPLPTPSQPESEPQQVETLPDVPEKTARHEATLRFEVEPVLFTNYYTNDATGSTHRTGSGFTTDQFEVNHLGWYTYEGKVVIAAATNECLRSTGPGCYLYSEVGEGFEVYNYKDTITFMFDEQGYEGIILDSCGACHALQPGEEHQRFDIFIADSSKSFGKKVGYLITETEW